MASLLFVHQRSPVIWLQEEPLLCLSREHENHSKHDHDVINQLKDKKRDSDSFELLWIDVCSFFVVCVYFHAVEKLVIFSWSVY